MTERAKIISMLRDIAARIGPAATPEWCLAEIERVANLLASWESADSPLAADADLIRLLEEQIVQLGTASEWARRHGFSRSFISDVLSGTRQVTDRLAAALGFERVRAWTAKE